MFCNTLVFRVHILKRARCVFCPTKIDVVYPKSQLFFISTKSEEEITQKLKAAPLEFTVRITAAIGNVWRESV